MLSMSDYINSVKKNAPINNTPAIKTVPINKNIYSNGAQESGFNSLNKNKNNKRNAIIAAIGIATISAIAFIKRKQIKKTLSCLFGKTENITPETVKSGTKNNKTTAVINNGSKKTAAKTSKEINAENIFIPNFGNNPNDAQKAEYIKSIKKYLFVNDKDTNLKAIEAIGKYGSYEDIDSLSTLLLSNDDEIIQAVSEAYVSINEPMASEVLIAAICGDKHNYKDETYIAILDGLKKLTKFSDETKEEKELILEPIRRLLEHKSEKVRMKAKEVLEGINNSWHHSTN